MFPNQILLIDDHALFRNGMAILLRTGLTNIEIHEADSVIEALHKVEFKPDLILLDIVMEGLNGIEGIALLRRRWARAQIVMVSSDSSAGTVEAARKCGATEHISKAKTGQEMLSLVKKVLARQTFEYGISYSYRGTRVDSVKLTLRQVEILELLSRGLPNKAIGRKLGLTENTVRWHVQNILSILNASSRTEATYIARKLGLVGG